MSLDGYDTLFGLIDRGELIGAPIKTKPLPRRSRFMSPLIPTGDPELDKLVIRPTVHKDQTVTYAHWDAGNQKWLVVRKQNFMFRSDYDTLPQLERERLERGGVRVEP
jgi:hypothetical protein